MLQLNSRQWVQQPKNLPEGGTRVDFLHPTDIVYKVRYVLERTKIGEREEVCKEIQGLSIGNFIWKPFPSKYRCSESVFTCRLFGNVRFFRRVLLYPDSGLGCVFGTLKYVIKVKYSIWKLVERMGQSKGHPKTPPSSYRELWFRLFRVLTFDFNRSETTTHGRSIPKHSETTPTRILYNCVQVLLIIIK